MSFVEASGPWRREPFGPYDWAIGPIDSPAASEDTHPARNRFRLRMRQLGVVCTVSPSGNRPTWNCPESTNTGDRHAISLS